MSHGFRTSTQYFARVYEVLHTVNHLGFHTSTQGFACVYENLHTSNNMSHGFGFFFFFFKFCTSQTVLHMVLQLKVRDRVRVSKIERTGMHLGLFEM